MDQLRITDPEHMPVLGLLVGSYLEAALRKPKAAQALRKLQGDAWLRAGRMWITLRFDRRCVEILPGRSAERRAVIEGEMDALLQAVASDSLLARARSVPDVARGRLRVMGHPGFLLRLVPLFVS